MTFALLFENFKIGHNSFVLGGRTLIFAMCVSYDKAFPMVP